MKDDERLTVGKYLQHKYNGRMSIEAYSFLLKSDEQVQQNG